MSSLKRLINPPVQPLLWLGGAVLLGLAGWSLLDLKMQDESRARQADGISVKIPDASVLDIPDLNSYPQMVSTPLFWEGRKAIEPPKAEVVEAVAAPVDTTLPEGRLIGIVDMGDSLFAIMQNAAGGSVHLRKGDTWGAWNVTGVDPDRLILGIGDQKQEIPLVADFSAPQENPEVAQARAIQQQQQQAGQQAGKPPPPQPAMQGQAQAMPVQPQVMPQAQNMPPQGAGLPFPADTEKQPPALSVKDALEARQRLMASRWGALAGDGQEQQPPAGK